MKPYLVFLGLGTSGAGIASLVSYGVKATDFSESVESLLEYEINNLQDKKRTTEEEKKLKELLEKKEIIRLEKVKDKIERLMKEVKDYFKEHFPKSENKEFLNSLDLLWIYWLDNMNDSQFKPNLDEEKEKLETSDKKEKFKSQYSKMKELAELWKDLSSKMKDFQSMLSVLQSLFK